MKNNPSRLRLIRFLQLMLVSFCFINGPVHASDINCKNEEKKKYEELICDYSILNSQYEEILTQQKKLLSNGKITEDALNSWREKRNLCRDVTCMDAVFADWSNESIALSRQLYTRQASENSAMYVNPPIEAPVRLNPARSSDVPKNSSLDNSVIAATTPYTTSEVSKASNANSSSSIEANTGSAAAEQNSSATTSSDQTHWGRNIFLFFIIVIIAKWILNRRRKILLAEARADHRLELLTKYRDENIVKKILARVIWIGETKEQLLDSLHNPEDIDVKAFKSKTQETWKYERTGKNRYALRVVLDDDIVVSYDDKR